jgi:hypothetical protein
MDSLVLVGGLEGGGCSLVKVYPDDGGQEFIHALLIGYFGVDLAPDEQHFGQQLDYAPILEERQLLVGATHILPDLLIEEEVVFLSYLVLTAYFLSGLTGAFIRGFLESDRGPYFPIDFGPPLASFLSVAHLFRVASRLATFCYQF